MAHSKRNTSSAVFTAHERSQLSSSWGTQRARLTRDSFLPFASCNLCLRAARAPVACAAGGHLFCRECALQNLLAQRAEGERLARRRGRERAAEADESARRADEERGRVVDEFERTERGHGRNAITTTTITNDGKQRFAAGDAVVDADNNNNNDNYGKDNDATRRGGTKKRKFALDEGSMLANAVEERARARRELDAEARAKALPSVLPSFWVPSLTPSARADPTAVKLRPVCPCSAPEGSGGEKGGEAGEGPHELSLKTLVDVHFSTSSTITGKHGVGGKKKRDGASGGEKEGAGTDREGGGGGDKVCPACSKPLSSATKAVLAVPCGHVVCKPCAGKFLAAEGADLHLELAKEKKNKGGAGSVRCYVCDADLSPEAEGEEDDEELETRAIEGAQGKEGVGAVGGGEDKAKRKKRKRDKKDKGKLKPGLVEIKSEGTGFAAGGKNMATKVGLAFQC